MAKKYNYMFAVWYNKQKIDSGLDKIVSFELPKGTGQKAHNRTQRRFGTSEKTAQVATLKSKEGINIFSRTFKFVTQSKIIQPGAKNSSK